MPAMLPDGVLGQAAQGAGNVWRETVVPTVAGGAVGMEASLFPHQYNRSNAPEGRQSARLRSRP